MRRVFWRDGVVVTRRPDDPIVTTTRMFDQSVALYEMALSAQRPVDCFSAILALVPETKRRLPNITLVGAGSLALALGAALKNAGYVIDAIVSRSTAESRRRAAALAKKISGTPLTLENFQPHADIIWLCHTDDALAETARLLARRGDWKARIVFHSSGALTSDILSPLHRAGASTASLHPMMTFVPGTYPEMAKVPFTVEGERHAVAAAKKISQRLKAQIFEIRKEAKVLYHALGSFSSPMIVATLVTAERVGKAAGLSSKQVKKVMTGILLQTIRNYIQRGPAAAFSGPIRRGDLNTVRRHLHELERVPGAIDVYRALVRSAMMDLPVANRKQLGRLLAETKPHHR